MKAFSNLSNPQLMIILIALVRERMTLRNEVTMLEPINTLNDRNVAVTKKIGILSELIEAIEVEYDGREKNGQ